MHLLLLSGGSGTRLWPLSNDARSKQFLQLLPAPDGSRESMIQRVVRQLEASGLQCSLTIATAAAQRDAVVSQLGEDIDIVLEPSRRHTFPAIALACEYLSKVKNVGDHEVIVVMPCDPFTEATYYDAVALMAKAVEEGDASLLAMGVMPVYPSAKYGYLLPAEDQADNPVIPVQRFIEKPSVPEAERLIAAGARWNAGVFAFRLGYMLRLAERYVSAPDYPAVLSRFADYPKISFDYEVAEKAESMAIVPYDGPWKDLGTWLTLTDELPEATFGNVVTDGNGNGTHIINELDLPILCLGTSDLVIAASPDGIIVSEKKRSEDVKQYARRLKSRPMYEERRWGVYKVLHHTEFPDGHCVLTKQLTLRPGCSISYQRHAWRDETWTFIDGEGELVLDGLLRRVTRGDTVHIPRGVRHALRAVTPLSFIEVQAGSNLIEEDIERFPWEWDSFSE